MVVGVGPVHALPSACLEEVEEQPEDADNQRNVTRTGGQPSDLSTAVRIPVTLTGPPGQTTVAPSEYLPSAAGQAPLVWAHFVLLLPLLLRSSHLGTELASGSLSAGESVLPASVPPRPFAFQGPEEHCHCYRSLKP